MQEKPNNKFLKQHRLLKKTEFDAVFNKRNSVSDQNIIIYFKYNQLQYNRLGLVIGRKAGNAVKRNRFKRIVREAFRKSTFNSEKCFDLVILPKKPLNTKLSSNDIEVSLAKLVTRLLKFVNPEG